jgi:3-phenylpropionate/cinnamic acid dioxygenase small subunit
MAIARHEIEDFLHHEAELLDDRRFEEWLTLFAEDGILWIPLDPNSDPRREPSILYDDKAGRAARVHQLLHQPHYSQMPPSRTVHAITNVRIGAPDASGDVFVRCNLMVTELRSAGPRTLQAGLGQQRMLAADCHYRLRRNQAGDWSIALKKIVLLNRDQPVDNLTFII